MKFEHTIYQDETRSITRVVPGILNAKGERNLLVSDLIKAQKEVAVELLRETGFDFRVFNFVLNVTGHKMNCIAEILDETSETLTSYRRGTKKPTKEKWQIIRYALRAVLIVDAKREVTHAGE